jgi:pimeloyl-ACP methyl ester carboxylesterase
MPKEPIDPQVKIVDERTAGSCIRRRVNYFVDEWTRVSAWMFVPEDEVDCPAILCLHGRTAAGKDEPAGLDTDDRLLAFASHYADRGYVTFAPDCIACGERATSRATPFDTKSFYKENPKWSAMGKMLWDHMRCLDVLNDTKEVDPGRIGVIGHDLGGTNALMLGAFDDRVRAIVASCGFIPFAADADPARWTRDENMNLMPRLQTSLESRTFPFEWDQLLALIAPNPALLVTATNDEAIVDAAQVDETIDRARRIYRLLGATDALEHLSHKAGHKMTVDGLEAADGWFDRWL